MWTKVKIIGLFIALITVTAAGFIFGRNADRRRVPNNNGLADDIRGGADRVDEGNKQAQDIAQRITRGIDQASDSANRAGDRIGNAQDQLRTALEILRAAKAKG